MVSRSYFGFHPISERALAGSPHKTLDSAACAFAASTRTSIGTKAIATSRSMIAATEVADKSWTLARARVVERAYSDYGQAVIQPVLYRQELRSDLTAGVRTPRTERRGFTQGHLCLAGLAVHLRRADNQHPAVKPKLAPRLQEIQSAAQVRLITLVGALKRIHHR